MAVRDGKKHSRSASARRYGVAMGGALSALVAAAAMATGSAAPAKADFEDLIDPIIQPLLTSFTDSLSAIDPAAAVDLTSWSDSLMASLNSIDVAAPAAAESAAASAASAEPAASTTTTGPYDIPITVAEGTEPTVNATVDGSSTTDLVDTGSSGLVIPYTDLGSSYLQQLEGLFSLGTPTGISESGYSGGVDYLYLTYNNVPVDYTTTTGTVDTTAPIEVEIYSWDPSNFDSYFTDNAFQNFLTDNQVTGILGIGNGTSGAAGESPIEAAGFGGVTVDLPGNELIVSDTNPFSPTDTLTSSGSTLSGLTETVRTGSGATVGSATVSDDIDSGGVYGTIPSSIDSSTLSNGDVVTVSDGAKELYSYTVTGSGADQAPTVTSGTSVDSGVQPFENNPIYIDYTNGTISFDSPTPAS
jgi:hypothetical protein